MENDLETITLECSTRSFFLWASTWGGPSKGILVSNRGDIMGIIVGLGLRV